MRWIYRHYFRETRPDSTETASQFIAKLQVYFGRWLDMAKVDKTLKVSGT